MDRMQELTPAMYAELRQIAKYQLRSSGSVTFEPTELVHDLFLKLKRSEAIMPSDEVHFFALCARAIRQIICDRAKSKRREKRDEKKVCVDITVSRIQDGSAPAIVDILEIDLALKELEATDRTSAQVVELRLFGGLNADQISQELGISTATIQRKWQIAKRWMIERLAEAGD